jgi:hypothetical protein
MVIIITKNLEKKIFANVCGDANTCFQVLFLNSICGIRLQISIMNIGSRKDEKACHPIPK